MKKPFKDTRFAKIIGGLVRESLQTLPIVGTIVTNLKSDSTDNPKGKIKLDKWDWYRIILGVGIAYALAKGILTTQQIQFIMGLIGF